MKPRKYKVTLYCRVDDARRAIAAARDEAARRGCPRSYVADARDAVWFLLDSTPADAGVQVEHSECEEVVAL